MIGGGRALIFCHAGLMDFSVDIVVNDEKLGAIIPVVQVLPNPPDEERFPQYRAGAWHRSEQHARALRKVQVSTEDKIRSAAELLGIIVNQLVNLEYFKFSNAECLDVLQKEIQNSTDLIQAINDKAPAI